MCGYTVLHSPSGFVCVCVCVESVHGKARGQRQVSSLIAVQLLSFNLVCVCASTLVYACACPYVFMGVNTDTCATEPKVKRQPQAPFLFCLTQQHLFLFASAWPGWLVSQPLGVLGSMLPSHAGSAEVTGIAL